MIKLSKLFLVFCFMLTLASCSDDDDPIMKESLVGTWKLASLVVNTETTNNFSGTISTVVSAIEGKNLDYELVFDETTFTTSGSYDLTYDVTFDGADFPIDDQSVSNVSGSGTYSTDGNTLTVSGSFFDLSVSGVDISALEGGNGETDYEINSNGELVFEQDEESTETESGVTVTSKIQSRSVWERQ